MRRKGGTEGEREVRKRKEYGGKEGRWSEVTCRCEMKINYRDNN